MSPRFILPALILSATISLPVAAATYNVADAGDLFAKFNGATGTITSLQAGDIVLLASGVYNGDLFTHPNPNGGPSTPPATGLDIVFNSAIADDDTARTNPIHVCAAVNGGVQMTGALKIALKGRGIVLAGLDFSNPTLFSHTSAAFPRDLVQTDSSSRYMRLSNLRFWRDPASSDGSATGAWISLSGFYHAVEFCSFVGKQNDDATVKLNAAIGDIDLADGQPAGLLRPRARTVRFNYFGRREALPANAQGVIPRVESIHVGGGDAQPIETQDVIAHNVFEKAVWSDTIEKPAAPGIIVIKASKTYIQHNTLLDSRGLINLRAGHGTLVEGNFIFGSGSYSATGDAITLSAAHTGQAGLQIIGRDHVVRNNYFENLRDRNNRAAVMLYAGYSDYTEGTGNPGSWTDQAYAPAHNVSLYNNTFVDCREIQLGFVPSVPPPPYEPVDALPTGVRIYNNAWESNSSAVGADRGVALGQIGAATFSAESGANHFFSSSGQYGAASTMSGFITGNPLSILQLANGYKIPNSDSSPVVDAASATLAATHDIRAFARPSTGRDVGCHEREITGPGFRPLWRYEVGPGYASGPVHTYPASPIFPLSTVGSLTQVAIEAEHFNRTRSVTTGSGSAKRTWQLASEAGGSSSDGLAINNAVTTTPDTTLTGAPNLPAPVGGQSPRVEYDISVPAGATGPFYVHLRGRRQAGDFAGSVYALITNSTTSSAPLAFSSTSLQWSTTASFQFQGAATLHTLRIWMHQDGTVVDKIVINTSATPPTGNGPPES